MKKIILMAIMAVLLVFSASAKDLVANSADSSMEIRFNSNNLKTEFSGYLVQNGNKAAGAEVSMICTANGNPVNQYTVISDENGDYYMSTESVVGTKCAYGNQAYFQVVFDGKTYVSETFVLSSERSSGRSSFGASSLQNDDSVSVPEFGSLTATFAIAGAGLVIVLLRKR